MKRIISMLLSLLMLFSLCGVVSAYAFGSESSGDVTVLFTGGIGTAVGGEGLSYAAAAALKDSYDKDEVLLVDAGGFNAGAADIMAAAGYDLAVPAGEIKGWTVASISMGVEGLKAGAMLEKNGTAIAFVGVVSLEELTAEDYTAEDYYADIQKSVDAAAGKADFIIALGAVDKPKELAENVSGLNAVLTYGKTTEETATVESESEDGVVTTTTVMSVGEAFDAIGALKLSKAIITAQVIDSQAFAKRDLTADAAVAELEAAFEPVKEDAEDEDTDNTDNAENGENNDNAENGEDENTENTDNTVNNDSIEAESGNSQNVDADAANAAVGGDDKNDAVESSPTDTDKKDDSITTDPPVETANASATNASTAVIEWDRSKGNDLSIMLEAAVVSVERMDGNTKEWTEFLPEYYDIGGGVTVTIHLSAVDTWGTGPYAFRFAFADGTSVDKTLKLSGTAPATSTTSPTPTPTQAPTTTEAPAATKADYTWKAGDADLVITLDKAVKSISVSGRLFEDKYYTLSEDGKTVTIKGDTFNAWKGDYKFEFTFTDGTKAEKIVSVTGATEATAKPSPTPVPNGPNPHTGDETPIGLYIAIFVVLLVVLIVAVVLVIRKNKKDKE